MIIIFYFHKEFYKHHLNFFFDLNSLLLLFFSVIDSKL